MIEINYILVILFGLILLRVFASSIMIIKGNNKPMTDRQRYSIGIFWLLASTITGILFLQVLI